MEAPGVEPGSRDALVTASTCVVGVLKSRRGRPASDTVRLQPARPSLADGGTGPLPEGQPAGLRPPEPRGLDPGDGLSN